MTPCICYTLSGFFDEIDPRAKGTNPDDGNRWGSRTGQDFAADHASPAFDYATLHMWPDNWRSAEAGPYDLSFGRNWIESHIKVCKLYSSLPGAGPEIWTPVHLGVDIPCVNDGMQPCRARPPRPNATQAAASMGKPLVLEGRGGFWPPLAGCVLCHLAETGSPRKVAASGWLAFPFCFPLENPIAVCNAEFGKVASQLTATAVRCAAAPRHFVGYVLGGVWTVSASNGGSCVYQPSSCAAAAEILGSKWSTGWLTRTSSKEGR